MITFSSRQRQPVMKWKVTIASNMLATQLDGAENLAVTGFYVSSTL